MATKEQIESTILEVAGNPAVGEIKELASAMAEAIVALDNPKTNKEVRVIEPKETR